MFKNFIKTSIRNLFRQKGYSLINLVGLALGIGCSLLLSLHVKEELSYEKEFPKHERIYRVVSTEWSKSSPSLAGEMMKYFPEIASIARFAQRGRDVVNTTFNTQTESVGFFADSSAVDMFDLKRVAGDPVKALTEPFAIVITSSMADKLFGKKDPINQKLYFGDNEELNVRAVIEDLKGNSHLKFDYLASMPTFYKYVSPDWTDNRGWMFGWTYVLFNKKEDIINAKKKLKDFYIRYYTPMESKEDAMADADKSRFQALTDIHLKSDLIQEMGTNSSIVYVYIFLAVQVLVLLIACVNFINLFTSQALKRMKEVGLKKLLGASRRQLALQFMGEAFLLTILASILAMIVYSISLPFYDHLTGRSVIFWDAFRMANLSILLIIIVSVGLVSGLFPALFISNFDPIHSLKATKVPRSTAAYLRKGLVVFQFIISGLLIISTVLIYQQMQLFKNKKLGFDKDQVIVARLYGKFKDKIIKDPELMRNEILKNPDILSVAKASNIIGDDLSVESVTPVGSSNPNDYPSVRVMRVDENYLTTLNIPIKEGRNFSIDFNDSASFIINEKAAEILKLRSPLNTRIVNNTMHLEGKVIGVTDNFHFASLHHQVEPLVLQYKPEWTGTMFIKIRAGKIPESINFLKSKIAAISPNTMFSYNFLDERIAGLYQKENNMSAILKLFTGLAIVISCLGLLGLIAHASALRTKEIGIRKVIGASLSDLIRLLSRDLILLVLLGNLLAWPLAWWAVNKWLQEFTYRIDIRISIFFYSTLVTLCIAWLTIAYHCLKTARANPVRSLRTE